MARFVARCHRRHPPPRHPCDLRFRRGCARRRHRPRRGGTDTGDDWGHTRRSDAATIQRYDDDVASLGDTGQQSIHRHLAPGGRLACHGSSPYSPAAGPSGEPGPQLHALLERFHRV